jgi:hypothetical protein
MTAHDKHIARSWAVNRPPLQSIRQKIKRATIWPLLGLAPVVG